MSNFTRIVKIIGRAIWRGLCSIGRFFKFIGKRISRNSKISKLNKRIDKKERDIERLYADIGRNYYEIHADDPEELLSELCGNVGADADFIEEAKEKIEDIRKEFDDARAAAKEKARARRTADKEKAKSEKMATAGDSAEHVDGETTAYVHVEHDAVDDAPAASSSSVFEAPAELVYTAPVSEEETPEQTAAPEEVPADPIAAAPVMEQESAPVVESPAEAPVYISPEETPVAADGEEPVISE